MVYSVHGSLSQMLEGSPAILLPRLRLRNGSENIMKYEQWVLSKCSPVGNKIRSGQLENWTIREDLITVQILVKGE